MADEVTLGEMIRRLEVIRQDCKEDTRELREVIDTKVSMERYQLEQVARDEAARLVLERIKSIEEARDQEERQRREDEQRQADRRAADRRLIFSALIAPVIMLFLTLYLSARGAGA
jgi:cytochrome c-type biogenesis protein CcmH/NrfG